MELSTCCIVYQAMWFKGAISQSAVQDGTGNRSQAFLTRAWDQFKKSQATAATRQSSAWRKSRSPQSLTREPGEINVGSILSLCSKISVLPGVAEQPPLGSRKGAGVQYSKSAERRLRQQWNLLLRKRAGGRPAFQALLSDTLISLQCIMTRDALCGWSRSVDTKSLCSCQTRRGRPDPCFLPSHEEH